MVKLLEEMECDDFDVVEKERVLDFFIREDGYVRFQEILLKEQSLISKAMESANASLMQSVLTRNQSVDEQTTLAKAVNMTLDLKATMVTADNLTEQPTKVDDKESQTMQEIQQRLIASSNDSQSTSLILNGAKNQSDAPDYRLRNLSISEHRPRTPIM